MAGFLMESQLMR